MNLILLILAVILMVVQFRVPSRHAFLPLLIAICHFQNVPVFEIGAAFTICKLIILTGLWRASRERRFARLKFGRLDTWVMIWTVWIFFSGFAHNPTDHNPITIRLSQVFDFGGGYLYARCYLTSREDFLRLAKALAILVVPMALMVALERVSLRNYYGLISGGAQEVVVRGSKLRASGPFGHPILLGTFAATSAVLLLTLWQRERRWVIAGGVACLLIVALSASSGPIVTLLSGLLGVAAWRWRQSVGRIRTLVILVFVALHMVMKAPVWYLMARIDLAGGSTGWHRAELITVALNHFNEWWLVGTEYTRHWIAYGVHWSENHIDITNHYIFMGVTGGLLLMSCYIGILRKAFQNLGRGMRLLRLSGNPGEFVLWCIGAALFAHCFTFLSISYFDQINVAFAMLLGSIPGVTSGAIPESATTLGDMPQRMSSNGFSGRESGVPVA
jgi:hypothetical protein